MKKRAKIQGYISPDLEKRLKQYCKAHNNCSESSVAEAAIQQFLDDTNDTALLLRRLDRQGRALERLQRDLDIQMEAFAVFTQIWFSHMPQLADEQKAAARHQGENRYKQYLDHVSKQFSSGHRFLDDLVKDEPATQEELAKLVEQEG